MKEVKTVCLVRLKATRQPTCQGPESGAWDFSWSQEAEEWERQAAGRWPEGRGVWVSEAKFGHCLCISRLLRGMKGIKKNFFWSHCVSCGVLVPWPGIEPMYPAWEVWTLNHWITRKASKCIFKKSVSNPAPAQFSLLEITTNFLPIIW